MEASVNQWHDSERPAPLSAEEKQRAVDHLANFEGNLDLQRFRNLVLMAFNSGVIKEAEYKSFMELTDPTLFNSVAVQLKIEVHRTLSEKKIDA